VKPDARRGIGNPSKAVTASKRNVRLTIIHPDSIFQILCLLTY
jgi:hypothetical protein